MTNRKPTDVSVILPNLCIGNYEASCDPNTKRELRVRHVLSLCDTSDACYADVNRLSIDILDSPSVHIADYFEQAIDFIHQARLRGECVLVHCIAGISRSSTVVLAYLITFLGLSFDQAFLFVRTKRPIINPNFGFLFQLRTFSEGPGVEAIRERLFAAAPEAAQRLFDSDTAEYGDTMQALQQTTASSVSIFADANPIVLEEAQPSTTSSSCKLLFGSNSTIVKRRKKLIERKSSSQECNLNASKLTASSSFVVSSTHHTNSSTTHDISSGTSLTAHSSFVSRKTERQLHMLTLGGNDPCEPPPSSAEDIFVQTAGPFPKTEDNGYRKSKCSGSSFEVGLSNKHDQD